MEDLESGSLSYTIVGEFLSDLKEEFSRGDDKILKVVKLKKVKQENEMMEELFQVEGYSERVSIRRRLLIEEFKR